MDRSRAFTPQLAADPGLSPSDQAEIARTRPDLLPWLAANPSLYPELRAWLATSADERVLGPLRGSSSVFDETLPIPAANTGPVQRTGVAERTGTAGLTDTSVLPPPSATGGPAARDYRPNSSAPAFLPAHGLPATPTATPDQGDADFELGEPKRKGRFLRILSIAIALVGLAAGLAALYFAGKNSGSAGSAGEASEAVVDQEVADQELEGLSVAPDLPPTPQELRATVDPNYVPRAAFDVPFFGDPVDVGDVTVTAFRERDWHRPNGLNVEMYSNWYDGLITIRPWSVTGIGTESGTVLQGYQGIGGVEHIEIGETLYGDFRFGGAGEIYDILQAHYADVDGGRATWFAHTDQFGDPLVVGGSSQALYHWGQRVRAGGITIALLDGNDSTLNLQICSIDYQGGFSTAPWSVLTDDDQIELPLPTGEGSGGKGYGGADSIRPGECFAGWVSFDSAAGGRPDTLIYNNGELGPYHWDLTAAADRYRPTR